jgi:hypothetical protein
MRSQVLRVLQQIAACTRLERSHVDVVAVHREHEHLRAFDALQDLPRRLDAVQLRHRDVHDDDVRAELLDEIDRGPAVARFADDLDLLVRLEDAAQALSDHGVIVNQEDANLLHREFLPS